MNQSELNYKVNVEPALFTILQEVERNVVGFGIERDTFIRALWVYADMRLNESETPPSWLWDELERKQQQADPSNIIDGEAGM